MKSTHFAPTKHYQLELVYNHHSSLKILGYSFFFFLALVTSAMLKGHPISSGNFYDTVDICLDSSLGVTVTLKMSSDNSLETGGSVWHAG